MSGDAWKEGGIDATGKHVWNFSFTCTRNYNKFFLHMSAQENASVVLYTCQLIVEYYLLIFRSVDGFDIESHFMWNKLQ